MSKLFLCKAKHGVGLTDRQDEKGPTTPDSDTMKKPEKHVLEKPKRPLSAYNLFFRDERAKILTEKTEGKHTLSSFGQLGKMIGERWSRVLPAVKSEYEKEAKMASDDYRLNLRKYHEQQDAMLVDLANEIEAKKHEQEKSSMPAQEECSRKRKKTEDAILQDLRVTEEEPYQGPSMALIGSQKARYTCEEQLGAALSAAMQGQDVTGAASLERSADHDRRHVLSFLSGLTQAQPEVERPLSLSNLTARETQIFQQGFQHGAAWRSDNPVQRSASVTGLTNEHLVAAQLDRRNQADVVSGTHDLWSTGAAPADASLNALLSALEQRNNTPRLSVADSLSLAGQLQSRDLLSEQIRQHHAQAALSNAYATNNLLQSLQKKHRR
jgi:hypothetical protein